MLGGFLTSKFGTENVFFIETLLQILVRFPASKDYLIGSQPEIAVYISDFSNWGNIGAGIM